MTLQDQMRELFKLDQQVRGLRSRLDAALRRQKAQQTRLEQLQQHKSELEQQHRHSQARANEYEQEAGELESRIQGLREQMNTVTNNKQYSAMLQEVDSLKKQKAKQEEQALEHLNEVELLTARVQESEDRLAQQQKLVDTAVQEVQSAEAEVGTRLEQANAERDRAATDIPDDALAQFDRLTESYDGEALAEVFEQNRKLMEYTCGGCYMSLPADRVNLVMGRPDELVTCPNCNRILYVNQELKSALGPS